MIVVRAIKVPIMLSFRMVFLSDSDSETSAEIQMFLGLAGKKTNINTTKQNYYDLHRH